MLLVSVLFIFAASAKAQVSENRYLVFFTDKDNTPYSISQPLEFLSQKAINRRNNQNIAIDVRDLPVDPAYIQAVQDLGDVQILYPLKWLNAILIETTDPNVLQALPGLPGFDRLEVSKILYGEIEPTSKLGHIPKSEAEYGPSLNQIDMLNGLQLHTDGFRGEGMLIATLDAGFNLAQNAAVLDSLFADNRIVGMRNFVDNNNDVFQRSNHGTYVLSTMAGLQIDSLIGTAPKASYFLGITEDSYIERRIEEAFWEIGAEYADSMGVDIINTSLGYTTFDVIDNNYTYSDMDGNTALITRASDIAASRGMLIVNSAGNSGSNSWYYISAPADGDSVLAIGAAKPDGEAANFSSRGPSFDGRVKPNVMAQGQGTIITDLGDGIKTGNGTSFASPVLAGMAACLWQAQPEATAWQVFQAIEQSASLFEMPNDSMGYGIPDFEIARTLLAQIVGVNEPYLPKEQNNFQVYPNPYSVGGIKTDLPTTVHFPASFALINASGMIISRAVAVQTKASFEKVLTQYINPATNGIYIVMLQDANRQVYVSKIVKQ